MHVHIHMHAHSHVHIHMHAHSHVHIHMHAHNQAELDHGMHEAEHLLTPLSPKAGSRIGLQSRASPSKCAILGFRPRLLTAHPDPNPQTKAPNPKSQLPTPPAFG